MKNLKVSLAVASALFVMAVSCSPQSNPSTEGLPPGQAKKVAGTKSAKPFAPGQQKKN